MEKEHTLTYGNVIEEFLESFPEYREKAEEERSWWHGDVGEEPLVYIFFGNVLNESLVEELRATEHPRLLKRIFDFFERMALSPDKKVPELLTMEILEYLGDDKARLKRARKMMGRKTLKLSHEIEKFLGRE